MRTFEAEFLQGKNPLGQWESHFGKEDFQKIMNDPELELFKDFVRGEHPQEEWEAFFAYVALPPWKRVLSRIVGMVLEILHL